MRPRKLKKKPGNVDICCDYWLCSIDGCCSIFPFRSFQSRPKALLSNLTRFKAIWSNRTWSKWFVTFKQISQVGVGVGLGVPTVILRHKSQEVRRAYKHTLCVGKNIFYSCECLHDNVCSKNKEDKLFYLTCSENIRRQTLGEMERWYSKYCQDTETAEKAPK